jgi:hypothetical protein
MARTRCRRERERERARSVAGRIEPELGDALADVAVVALHVRASPMLKRRRCWVEVVERSEAQLLARWIEKWSYGGSDAWPGRAWR